MGLFSFIKKAVTSVVTTVKSIVTPKPAPVVSTPIKTNPPISTPKPKENIITKTLTKAFTALATNPVVQAIYGQPKALEKDLATKAVVTAGGATAIMTGGASLIPIALATTGGVIATNALIESPKLANQAKNVITKTDVSKFGSDIGAFAENPSLSTAKAIAVNNPYLTGAVAVAGAFVTAKMITPIALASSGIGKDDITVKIPEQPSYKTTMPVESAPQVIYIQPSPLTAPVETAVNPISQTPEVIPVAKPKKKAPKKKKKAKKKTIKRKKASKKKRKKSKKK